MRSFFQKAFLEISNSYWVVPLTMVLSALVLATCLYLVDLHWSAAEWGQWLPIPPATAEGAREMLGTIAGAVIGVAGVTFSITIVAVSFAGANFGPRLVGNFMRDRANQFTVGAFVATFVYALAAMRSVDGPPPGAGEEFFVPQITVFAAIVLSIGCVGLFLYFIHHVPETLNVANLSASIGRQLTKQLKSEFGRDRRMPSDRDMRSWDAAMPSQYLSLHDEGYIQTADLETLGAFASKHDVRLRLFKRPGDFVTADDMLLGFQPVRPFDDEMQKRLTDCIKLGRDRTPYQNVLFLVDELVEVIARALSPGVNDPLTAMNCLNWLAAALIEFVMHCEDEETDRKGWVDFANPITFRQLLSASFDQCRPYLVADRNTALHLIERLAAIRAACRTEEQRRNVEEHLMRTRSAIFAVQPEPYWRDEAEASLSQIETDLSEAMPTSAND